MKTLSIKQPWAHLMAIGIKDIENRSWPTSYRGKILIHVGQKIDSRFRAMNILFTPQQWLAMSVQEQRKAVTGMYDMSAIIGHVDIIGCVNNSDSVWAEPGQWHWQLSNAVYYPKPLLNVKGKLSFWDYNIEGLKEWERDRGLGA